MKKRLMSMACAIITAIMAASAATADTLTIASAHLSTPMRVTVIKPDRAATHPGERFPSVYLLNGFGGGYKDWGARQPRLHELSDAYGMILVMPDGRDSWYWDSPEHPEMRMETFFTTDLVNAIDSNLPTIKSASKRAISGLSMGGHGALWLAMRHPDIWGNAASMSGGVDIRPFPNNWKMKQWLGEKDAQEQCWEEHTVINLVPGLKNRQINLLIDCGADDFFYQVNLNLHEALAKHGIDHDFISRPGKHTWDYWRNSVLYHLLYFNEAFNKGEK